MLSIDVRKNGVANWTPMDSILGNSGGFVSQSSPWHEFVIPLNGMWMIRCNSALSPNAKSQPNSMEELPRQRTIVHRARTVRIGSRWTFVLRLKASQMRWWNGARSIHNPPMKYSMLKAMEYPQADPRASLPGLPSIIPD